KFLSFRGATPLPWGGLGLFLGALSVCRGFGALFSGNSLWLRGLRLRRLRDQEQLWVMDFKPEQGGGVAGEGSGSELGRGDGHCSVGKRLVSGLDTGVGNAGDARARTQKRCLRVALGGSGEFLVGEELAFGVDEHAGLDQLSQ